MNLRRNVVLWKRKTHSKKHRKWGWNTRKLAFFILSSFFIIKVKESWALVTHFFLLESESGNFLNFIFMWLARNFSLPRIHFVHLQSYKFSLVTFFLGVLFAEYCVVCTMKFTSSYRLSNIRMESRIRTKKNTTFIFHILIRRRSLPQLFFRIFVQNFLEKKA